MLSNQVFHKIIPQKLNVFFLLSLICALTLTGCGSNPELTSYKANMEQFFENVKVYDQSINAIDPESETAATDLLALLDSMDKSFAQMASLEVPNGFPGVDELADEASDYMTEAVSYFHQAYEAETFDPVLADVAKQNYDRANLRIQYILSILHGDLPEEIYSDVSDDEDTTDTGNENTGNEGDAPREPADSGSEDDFDTDDTVFYDDMQESGSDEDTE